MEKGFISMSESIFSHPTVVAAEQYAREAHEGQFREFSGDPYITHPIAVARLVASVIPTVTAVAAALLHDVLEDTKRPRAEVEAEMRQMFGDIIVDIVIQLSHVATLNDGDRATRFAINMAHTLKGGRTVQTIRTADIIHNAPTMAQGKPRFAFATYLPEKLILLQNMEKAHPVLLSRAYTLVTELLSRRPNAETK